jgi:hypothetical protein
MREGLSVCVLLSRYLTESFEAANCRWKRSIEPARAETTGRSVRERGGRKSTQAAVPAGRLQQ